MYIHSFVYFQTGWTKGKLTCTNCQGRLGSFNFVSPMKCSCGQHNLPAVHVVKDRIDKIVRSSKVRSINLLPASRPSRNGTYALIADPGTSCAQNAYNMNSDLKLPCFADKIVTRERSIVDSSRDVNDSNVVVEQLFVDLPQYRDHLRQYRDNYEDFTDNIQSYSRRKKYCRHRNELRKEGGTTDEVDMRRSPESNPRVADLLNDVGDITDTNPFDPLESEPVPEQENMSGDEKKDWLEQVSLKLKIDKRYIFI